jgi:hypothetical protein
LLGSGTWPSGGEVRHVQKHYSLTETIQIDIVEGVNGGTLNQASMHITKG